MKRTHNFPDKITIVLKKRTNQGYIAFDEKSIESGKNWAGRYHHEEGASYELLEYTNGNFKARLSKAAERSYSQGGKLSFWTLEIEAPDGRKFDVGINSDSLIETMFEITVTKGELEGRFYLGRTNSQQSMAIKGGLYYREYLEVVNTKKKPLTKKYMVGNIIQNARQEYKLVGELPVYIEVVMPEEVMLGRQNTYEPFYFKLELLNKPKKKFFYISKSRYDDTWGSYVLCRDKKMGGRVLDDSTMSSKNPHTLHEMVELEKRINGYEKDRTYYLHSLGHYLEELLALKEIKTVEEAMEEVAKYNFVEKLRH